MREIHIPIRGLILFLFLFSCTGVYAQKLGVKTNVIGLATATINAGLEIGLAKHWSVELNCGYNPFTFGDKKKTHLFALQPELRYWIGHRFAGHFFGLHGNYAEYDWALKAFRYKGSLWGVGASYGYALSVHKSWSIEGVLGLGCTRLNTKYRFDRYDSQSMFQPNSKNSWGLTKIGISIIYLIK